jgi:hypothetical protein
LRFWSLVIGIFSRGWISLGDSTRFGHIAFRKFTAIGADCS